MKKTILKIALGLSILAPNLAHAGWTDSFWFEPSILCVAGGGAGYATTSSSSGNQGTNAAIGCAAGALIGYFMNTHYQNKFTIQQQKEINDLRRVINQMQVMQSQQQLNSDPDGKYFMITEKPVQSKKTERGTILAPTKEFILTLPDEGVRFGDE